MKAWKPYEFVCEQDKRIFIFQKISEAKGSLRLTAKAKQDAEKYADRSAFIANTFIKKMIAQNNHYKLI